MTVEVQTAADVLRAAKAILLERGWGPFDDHAGVSVYHAVALAVLGHALGEGGPLESEAAWTVAIYSACRFVERFIPKPRYVGIADWETDERRTEREVLLTLEMGILAAEFSMAGLVAA